MKIIFIDYSTRLKKVDPHAPRGGMITSLFKVSDHLALHGHDVTVLCDIEEPGFSSAGVCWRNYDANAFELCDVLICNRGTGSGYPEIAARRRILWTHDLPHSGFIPNPQTMLAFDLTVFMSGYAEKVWRTFYKTIGKSVCIPNGVDKELFYPRPCKDLEKIVYFSHPNRGLKRLGFIADCINTRAPGAHVHAYSGGSMYPTDAEMSDHVDVESYAFEHPRALHLHAPLPQTELAEVVGSAGLCVLPTGYPEICSNSVLQALASGTPIVTAGGLGSVPEWVKHKKNGMLTTFLPNDYMVYVVEIVRNAVEVLSNRNLHRKLINGCNKTKILTWEEVGEKWLNILK